MGIPYIKTSLRIIQTKKANKSVMEVEVEVIVSKTFSSSKI